MTGHDRRPRRATRPATGGVEQRGGRPDLTREEADELERTSADSDEHGRWLQEQRPPHWE